MEASHFVHRNSKFHVFVMWKFGIDLSNFTVRKMHKLVRCFWGCQLGLCLMVTGWTSAALCFVLFFKTQWNRRVGIGFKEVQNYLHWLWYLTATGITGWLDGNGRIILERIFLLSLAVDGVSRLTLLSWSWCLWIPLATMQGMVWKLNEFITKRWERSWRG